MHRNECTGGFVDLGNLQRGPILGRLVRESAEGSPGSRTPRRSAANRDLGLLISTACQPHRDWIGISGSRGSGCDQDGSGSRDWIGIGISGSRTSFQPFKAGSGSRLGSRWIGISNLISILHYWIGISGFRTSRRSAANRTPRDRLLLEGSPPQGACRGSARGAEHS